MVLGARALRDRACLQGLVLLAGLVVVALVLALWPRPPTDPHHPYDHDDIGAVSQATTAITPGEVGEVARGLERRGYWCVQPRANAESVQVRCQAHRHNTVDLIATTSGDLAYASMSLTPWTEAEATTSSTSSAEEEMWTVLDASLLRLWPEGRDAVKGMLSDAQPFEFMPFGGAAEPRGPDYVWYDARTSHATWSLWARSVGTPVMLIVRTDHLRDRTWPYASKHYATTPQAATAGMVAQGFSCDEAGCYREQGSDGHDSKINFHLDVHDGQVVSTELVLRTGLHNEDTAPDTTGRWLAKGPPFLAPGVREAVTRRIQLSRATSQDWHGVVAETPLDITVFGGRVSTPDGERALGVSAVIGTPLVQIFIPKR